MKTLLGILKILAIGLLSLTAGCTVGPDYRKPDPLANGKALPAHFKETAVPMQPAVPRDALPRGPWWTFFNDAILDDLMGQLNDANQDIAASEAKYRQASSVQAQAQAALWPTVSGGASALHGTTAPGGSVTDTLSLSVAASWEVDLWGRIRRNLEASVTSAQAAAMDVEATRLSLQAQLASNYIALRVLDVQEELLATTVKAYERSLKLTRNRYAAGVVSKADVALAETQLQTTRAQAIDLGVQRANLEHAIAVLAGKAPSEVSLPQLSYLPLSFPDLPAVFPAEVLERRPDVAAAERRVASANAQIGVAESAFFPTLSLDAGGGYRGASLNDLLTLPNRVWSVGPSLAMTLFDGGSRTAITEEAKANYDQVVAVYRQTVLTALQETEDNLAALRILQQETQEQQLAVNAANTSATLVSNQYQAGTVSYLNVVVVQAARLAAERNLLSIQGQRYAAAIALVKAIGGGWNQ